MTHRNPPVQLHDVKDVEGLCKAVLLKSSADLNAEQFDDALGDLLLAAVEMSGIRAGRYRYNSGNCPPGVWDPSVGTIFSLYLWKLLPNRLVDWRRKNLGDSRYKSSRPEFVPFEAKHVEAEIDHDDFVEQIIEAASLADDLAGLSPAASLVIDEVVRPIARGEKHDDVARRLGISRRKVTRLLELVRNEILGLGLSLDLAPGATTDEVVEALHALPLDDLDPDTEDA